MTTVAVPTRVFDATLVARTVTDCEEVTVEGAVYRPVDEIEPMGELSDQVTAVLVVPVMLAENCIRCAGASVALPGDTVTDMVFCGETCTEVVLVMPAAVAVNAMFVVELAEVAWRVNAADVEPEGTVTVEGTVTPTPVAEYPIATGNPEAPAAAVSATVHCVDPGAVSVAGEHEMPDRATDRLIVIVPADDAVGMVSPAGEDAEGVRTWTDVVAALVFASVKVAFAIVPLATLVVLVPDMIHVYRPEPPAAQSIVFEAATALPAGTTETPVISAVE